MWFKKFPLGYREACLSYASLSQPGTSHQGQLHSSLCLFQPGGTSLVTVLLILILCGLEVFAKDTALS